MGVRVEKKRYVEVRKQTGWYRLDRRGARASGPDEWGARAARARAGVTRRAGRAGQGGRQCGRAPPRAARMPPMVSAPSPLCPTLCAVPSRSRPTTLDSTTLPTSAAAHCANHLSALLVFLFVLPEDCE